MSDSTIIPEQGGPHDGMTRREIPAGDDSPTRREIPADGGGPHDGMTRREDPGGAPAVVPGSRRLNLPAAVTADYEYLGDRSSGGEADIALLRDRRSGEEVILKYYKTGITPDPMAMLMLSRADPAHVVRLIDFHDEADGTWEIQEYCPTGSLREWAARRGGRLDAATLRRVLEEITGALTYLHGLGSGIAHRDLKPANILVRAEDPLDLVLADFGLAKAQQAVTHLTSTIKGTWHYAAPEVHAQQSSAKSDWFSLGAMIYEFYTGRQLFSMADGSEIGADDARARCQARNYSTELVDDPRWRLLVDGLLTWDKDQRWGPAQVEAWMRGESPAVQGERAPEPNRRVGYRPSWTPVLVRTPQELADQFRRHWDEAASELAGRPDIKMTRFLERFPDMQDAIRVIGSTEAPDPKLVRLQAILDPQGPIHYEGAALDEDSLARRIRAADSGDEAALDWLHSLVCEHILTAYAEVSDSEHAARADYLLGRWHDQAEALTGPLPADYQPLARRAYRTALPEMCAIALRDGAGGSGGGSARMAAAARRAAADDVGAMNWVRNIVGRVEAAADDDLGILAVARAVLARATDERRAQVARREAQEARRIQEEAAAASAARERERRARNKRRLSRLPGQLAARTLTSAIYCALAGWAQATAQIGALSTSTDLIWAFARPILVACLVSAGLATVLDWFLDSPDGSFGLPAISVGLLIGAGEWVAFLSSRVSGTTGGGDLGLMPWSFGISWMIGETLDFIGKRITERYPKNRTSQGIRSAKVWLNLSATLAALTGVSALFADNCLGQCRTEALADMTRVCQRADFLHVDVLGIGSSAPAVVALAVLVCFLRLAAPTAARASQPLGAVMAVAVPVLGVITLLAYIPNPVSLLVGAILGAVP